MLVGVLLGSFLASRGARTVSTAPSPVGGDPIPPAPDGAAPPREGPNCRDLYALACGRRDVTADPSGVVQPNVKGEIEALRLYEEIIHQNPGWTSDQVDQALVEKIYTERRRKRLLETFAWVMGRMKNLVERQPTSVFTPLVKKQIKERLENTVLELPPPASLYASEPDLFTKNEVYYETLEGGRRVIRVGGAYLLTAKSWFNRVFTFSHELAHAIDPCELQSAKIAVPAYRRLAGCFYKQGITRISAEALNCGQKNRIGEAFADWIAAEITADALQTFEPKFKTPEDRVHSAMNAVRDLCNQESWIVESESESYPEPHIRIGIIFGRHPRILQTLGCAPPPDAPPYCAFEGS